MSKEKSSPKQVLDNQCPDCNFTGNKKFPKGFAKENFQKTSIIEDSLGEEISIPIYDSITGEPILVSRRRCPVCGFKEGELIG